MLIIRPNRICLILYGDYSSCTLNLTLDRCQIAGNAAFYDGGAIYIEGNNNVSFTARNCVIENNYSGGGEYRTGGGAIYANGAALLFDRCRIENNSANHLLPDMEHPPEDLLQGGGLCIQNSKLKLTDSLIVGNTASMGGIALTNTDVLIDACIFTKNRAEQHSFNWTGSLGPWNNMAQGGAIYHTGDSGSKTTIINSSIYDNSAENAYGGIYSYYGGNDNGVIVCGILNGGHEYEHDNKKFIFWKPGLWQE